MYLSKLLLNPRDEQAGLDLASPYDLHRTLGRVFPEAETQHYRSECDVLFRIEDAQPLGVPVLMQSSVEPDWTQLPEGYALRTEGPKHVALSLRQDQICRFRFVGNPTIRRMSSKVKNARRIPLVHASPNKKGYPTYFDWLERQADRCGFKVLEVKDAPFRLAQRRGRARAMDETPLNPDKPELPLFGVRFDGVLRVTQPEKLLNAVRKGIGPAKAFGFGLLSLAPAR